MSHFKAFEKAAILQLASISNHIHKLTKMHPKENRYTNEFLSFYVKSCAPKRSKKQNTKSNRIKNLHLEEVIIYKLMEFTLTDEWQWG